MCKRYHSSTGRIVVKVAAWAGLLLTASAVMPAAAQGAFIDGEQFRDPTQPAHLSAAPAVPQPGALWQAPDRNRYALSFIRTGGERSIAVINNQAVGIGDRVEDAIVRDIRATEVILVVSGRELVLSTVSLPVRESVN